MNFQGAITDLMKGFSRILHWVLHGRPRQELCGHRQITKHLKNQDSHQLPG